MSRHTPGWEAHITRWTFGISILPAYNLIPFSFIKPLIKSQEVAPLSLCSTFYPFTIPLTVIQIKSHDFIPACPWWVTTCFAAGGSFSLHETVFKPALPSGSIRQILVPLKLSVQLPSHDHSHNPKPSCNYSKKTKNCSSLKTCFSNPRFNGLFAPSGDYILWHFAQSNRCYKQLFLKLWPLFTGFA